MELKAGSKSLWLEGVCIRMRRVYADRIAFVQREQAPPGVDGECYIQSCSGHIDFAHTIQSSHIVSSWRPKRQSWLHTLR